MSQPILVSACLLGLPTRYDGRHKGNHRVLQHLRDNQLLVIPVCPEQLAGLPTPRPPCWFVEGGGCEVLDGTGLTLRSDGLQMNELLIHGAEVTLSVARLTGCQTALFKEGSPSCGVRRIYRQQLSVPGQGVTTALLQRHGLQICGEEEI